MSFVRTLKVPLKSGDTTLKFTYCTSFREKGSRRAKYKSIYLTSIRASQLADTKNPDYRRKFWLKYRIKMQKLGIDPTSAQFQLLQIGIFATWRRLGYPC